MDRRNAKKKDSVEYGDRQSHLRAQQLKLQYTVGFADNLNWKIRRNSMLCYELSTILKQSLLHEQEETEKGKTPSTKQDTINSLYDHAKFLG